MLSFHRARARHPELSRQPQTVPGPSKKNPVRGPHSCRDMGREGGNRASQPPSPSFAWCLLTPAITPNQMVVQAYPAASHLCGSLTVSSACNEISPLQVHPVFSLWSARNSCFVLMNSSSTVSLRWSCSHKDWQLVYLVHSHLLYETADCLKTEPMST